MKPSKPLSLSSRRWVLQSLPSLDVNREKMRIRQAEIRNLVDAIFLKLGLDKRRVDHAAGPVVEVSLHL